jgi:hypothetical protein
MKTLPDSNNRFAYRLFFCRAVIVTMFIERYRSPIKLLSLGICLGMALLYTGIMVYQDYVGLADFHAFIDETWVEHDISYALSLFGGCLFLWAFFAKLLSGVKIVYKTVDVNPEQDYYTSQYEPAPTPDEVRRQHSGYTGPAIYTGEK